MNHRTVGKTVYRQKSQIVENYRTNLEPPMHRYNSNFDKMLYHRRKHKVKHKKKHKEERKHKSQALPQPSLPSPQQLDCPQEPQVTAAVAVAVAAADEAGQQQQQQGDASAYTAIKEQCLKQKLSISLKRLNTNAYAARCDDYPVSNASSGPGATSDDEEDEEEEDEESHEVDEVAAETAPDFPPPEHPLVMRLAAAATPVEHCLGEAGRRMDVGDVVWGKVHGFPWWPGKVRTRGWRCGSFDCLSLLPIQIVRIVLEKFWKFSFPFFFFFFSISLVSSDLRQFMTPSSDVE